MLASCGGIDPLNWLSPRDSHVRLERLASCGGIDPLNWLDLRNQPCQVREIGELWRDRSAQLVRHKNQPCQVREIAELWRDRPAQLILWEEQLDDATAAVGRNTVPIVERFIAKPVFVVPPHWTVRGMIERNQHVPVGRSSSPRQCWLVWRDWHRSGGILPLTIFFWSRSNPFKLGRFLSSTGIGPLSWLCERSDWKGCDVRLERLPSCGGIDPLN